MIETGIRQYLQRSLLILIPHLAGSLYVHQLIWPDGGPTLIWPSAGIAFAALLLFGVGYWPVIAVSTLLAELLWARPGQPLAYLPFVVAAPTVSVVVGVWVSRRLAAGQSPVGNRVKDLGQMLAGATSVAVLSGLIGAFGLSVTGPHGWSGMPKAWALWSMGDLFGIVVCTPAVLRIYQLANSGRLSPLEQPYSERWERLSWLLLLILSAWLLAPIGEPDKSPLHGLLFLPLALLAWSAVRLEPIFTAITVMFFGLAVASLSSFGLGGLETPRTLSESAVIALFVAVLSMMPHMLCALEFERRRLLADLELAAHQDDLTGLLNRQGFKSALERLLEQRSRSGERFAVAHVDLDQFKLINDACGASGGDAFLAQLGSVLRASLRPSDELARIGGDEFAILWRQVDAEQAEILAEDLLRTVDAFRFPSAGRVLSLTASIGLHCFQDSDQDAGQIQREAGAAAISAKEHGGNRVKKVADVDLEVRQRQAAMEWAIRLNEALEHDRFRLYAQRMFALNGSAQSGVCIEVLLRMEDPVDGLLLPGRFIPPAERFGLSARLDRHVLKRVFAWFRSHPEALAQVKRVSVNLSAASLGDEELLPFLQRLLEESEFPPRKLCLEITETDAIRDLARTRTLMEGLRGLGVCFALDDFGSGFCSFGYLRSLPVESVKIDGSFVRDLADDPSDRAIVRAIVEVAKSLGKQTIAECVEGEAARAMVAALEVDYAQGYALHRPEPLADCLDTRRLAAETPTASR